jgi:hypothetical protein
MIGGQNGNVCFIGRLRMTSDRVWLVRRLRLVRRLPLITPISRSKNEQDSLFAWVSFRSKYGGLVGQF